jgi:phosphatidylglycerophosphatase A
MLRPNTNAITLFGIGRLRPAPGTWGSLPPIILAALLFAAGLGQTAWPDAPNPALAQWHPLYWNVYHAAILALFAFASAACIVQGTAAEARFMTKDPSNVVADETAGQCIPLLFLPAAAIDSPARTAFTLLFAFLAFRAMDILKPWPAFRLQRIPGGMGILIDDLVAGVYALAIVQVALALAT